MHTVNSLAPFEKEAYYLLLSEFHMMYRMKVVFLGLRRQLEDTFERYLIRFRGSRLKILLSLSVLFSLAFAFEAGFLVGRDRRVEPVIVRIPADQSASPHPQPESPAQAGESKNIAEPGSFKAGNVPNVSSAKETPSEGMGKCTFVGSRNSDKYHLPSCSWAKRIKPENRVCFSSAAEAESRGYKPGCVK